MTSKAYRKALRKEMLRICFDAADGTAEERRALAIRMVDEALEKERLNSGEVECSNAQVYTIQ